MLNQVLKVSSGICQQFVEVLWKSVTFLAFRFSQSSVATYCRWGGHLCDVYIENFLTNHPLKKFESCSTFAKVIIKHQTAYFLEHGVLRYYGFCHHSTGSRSLNFMSFHWYRLFLLFSSMRGRQQLSCPVLRPPSGPNARFQDNIHLT